MRRIGIKPLSYELPSEKLFTISRKPAAANNIISCVQILTQTLVTNIHQKSLAVLKDGNFAPPC